MRELAKASTVGLEALSTVQETTRQRLERNRKSLIDQIAIIDRALELLSSHPEMEELQDLLRMV